MVGFDVKSGLLSLMTSQVSPLAGCDVSRPNKLTFASTVLMIGSLAGMGCHVLASPCVPFAFHL